MDWLLELWRQALGPWIEPLLGSVRAWRITTLVLFTALIGIVWRRRWLAEWVLGHDYVERDRALFARANEILKESDLDELLNREIYNHRYSWDLLAPVRTFHIEFSREGNQFGDRRVRAATLVLIAELRRVDRFVALNFFPTEQDTYRLYPELKHSPNAEDRERYRAHADEIGPLLDAAWKAYRNFRATVRRRLKV